MTETSVFRVTVLNTLPAFRSQFDCAVTPVIQGFSRRFGCLAPRIIPFSWRGRLHASCCKNRGSSWNMMPGLLSVSTGRRAEWDSRWSRYGP
jgi:hypothetical protein